jgi:hypothetical protein
VSAPRGGRPGGPGRQANEHGDDPRDEPRAPAWLARRKRGLRIALVVFTVPSVALVLLTVGLVISNERAHDEARCPFVPVETRAVGEGAAVREDRRACVDGLEERRWLVLRGRDVLEVGRRRLASSFYAPEKYAWEPRLEADGVAVAVRNEGAPPVTYRESVALHGPGRPGSRTSGAAR